MTREVKEIIERLKKRDDGTLGIVKKIMKEVLDDCSEKKWSETMDEVFWEMDEINGLHK